MTFFVLAFSVVSLVFYYVSKPEIDPLANPLAVKQNEAPLNEQFNRIHLGGPVNQPPALRQPQASFLAPAGALGLVRAGGFKSQVGEGSGGQGDCDGAGGGDAALSGCQ